MPLPSGSALNRDIAGAGAPSYQTPGNSLHGASPVSFNVREPGRRDSLGTSMGTPLISPTRGNRRDSLGASVGGTPLFSPNANGNRRPELGRSDGPRQGMRTARRREPSVPMSQIDDPDVRRCPHPPLPTTRAPASDLLTAVPHSSS